MATAHAFFCKPVNPDTANALLHAVRALTSELDQQNAPKWDTVHLSLASGGGDIIPAFALFNEFKGLPVNLHTHNAAAVDSAAILPFIIGSRRTASAASAFFFHRLSWSFATKDALTMNVISDATKWLTQYETMMAQVVSERTTLSPDEVLKLMREGTSVDPPKAKQWGLIHEIEERSIAYNARAWQV